MSFKCATSFTQRNRISNIAVLRFRITRIIVSLAQLNQRKLIVSGLTVVDCIDHMPQDIFQCSFRSPTIIIFTRKDITTFKLLPTFQQRLK